MLYQLSYASPMERETGIGPATNSLEGCDSTTELLPQRNPLYQDGRRPAKLCRVPEIATGQNGSRTSKCGCGTSPKAERMPRKAASPAPEFPQPRCMKTSRWPSPLAN